MTRVLRNFWIAIALLVGAFVVSWVIYMPDAQKRGVWRAETGGMILTLTPFQAKLYSESGASCIHQLTFPAHLKLVEFAEGATLRSVQDTLLLDLDGTLEQTPFTRIDALPETCTTANPNATADDVFEAMWTAMNEHYAFFDLHGVDWEARRALAPAAATLKDEDTFALLAQALEGLDDGHVQLGSPLGYFSPAQAPVWWDDSFTPEGLRQIARDTVGGSLTSVDLTGIEYTLLANGIGYVLIRDMGIETPFGAKSLPAMQLAFDEVATALEAAETIIIDLRYNPGGSDPVAFGVASHFIDAPLDVLRKTTRDGDGQSAPFTATLMPFDQSPLTQPVIVLTSKLTGSAAEILTLAFREMPQVSTMGEATSGGLSDILSFKLPNGWDLGLSHQTYRAMDGALYEAIGIPPDIPYAIDADALTRGEDPLLTAAFARARDL